LSQRRFEVVISNLADVDQVRRSVRALAVELGMAPYASDELALATTELATNLVRHALRGWMSFGAYESVGRAGMEVQALDEGPGISDLAAALSDGYSTTGSLGSGLPAAQRLVDEFEIASTPAGTRVTVRKWLSARL
jgi:serine/threonine-protein kinase RsbT